MNKYGAFILWPQFLEAKDKQHLFQHLEQLLIYMMSEFYRPATASFDVTISLAVWVKNLISLKKR